MKASLEQQRQSRFAASVQREERGVLHVLPSLQQGKNQAGTPHAKEVRAVAACSPTQEKFDTRAFVFACLQENPDLKLAEIEQRALAAGQELSQPTASRYRKQYFASRESSDESNHESGKRL